jgi:hypothetical protein
MLNVNPFGQNGRKRWMRPRIRYRWALVACATPSPSGGLRGRLQACAALRREGAVARGLRRRPTGGRGRSWPAPPSDGRARSLEACAAVRREGAVARGLRRRPTGGRGRSWPAPPSDGRARSLVACAAVRREGAVARGLRRMVARWVCGICLRCVCGCTLSWPSYPVIIIIIFISEPSFLAQ